MNGNETETSANTPVQTLDGSEPSYDSHSLNPSSRSQNADEAPYTAFAVQVLPLILFLNNSPADFFVCVGLGGVVY